MHQLTVVSSSCPTRPAVGDVYIVPEPRPVSLPKSLPSVSVAGVGAGASGGPSAGAGDASSRAQGPQQGQEQQLQLQEQQRLADCGSASSTGASEGDLGGPGPEPAYLLDNDDFSLFELMSPVAATSSGF